MREMDEGLKGAGIDAQWTGFYMMIRRCIQSEHPISLLVFPKASSKRYHSSIAFTCFLNAFCWTMLCSVLHDAYVIIVFKGDQFTVISSTCDFLLPP
jgi:hypothetical protein